MVGPEGNPIPGARVVVVEDQRSAIRTTDAEGRLALSHSRSPANFMLQITADGYGPYLADWSSQSHDQRVPLQFTVELEAAWSVGAVLIDKEGKPIEGAKVFSGIEFKKRAGDHRQIAYGTDLKSDAEGRWRFHCVPVSKTQIFVQINHPDHMALNRSLSRADFGLERGREPTAKIVLEPGLTVSGRVTDEAGRPIAGALVRTKLNVDSRQATTGADGTYRLTGCDAQPVRIVVSSPGRALDVRDVQIKPAMGPVNFQMSPGRTVIVRVLDERGQPVPRARIFFQRWRGQYAYFAFQNVNQFTDNDGLWVWNEAPADEFTADICRPDGMELNQQPLVAREQEHVFHASPALVVSGRVVDATTKKPVTTFQVVPGVRFRPENEIQKPAVAIKGSRDVPAIESDDPSLAWNATESYTASDGAYRFRWTRGEVAHLIRIEADGYRPAVSREVKSNEGHVSIDFALERDKGMAAKVVSPRNQAAAGTGSRSWTRVPRSSSETAKLTTVCRRVCAPTPTKPAASSSRSRRRYFISSSPILRDMLIFVHRPNGPSCESSICNPGPEPREPFGLAACRSHTFRSRCTRMALR